MIYPLLYKDEPIRILRVYVDSMRDAARLGSRPRDMLLAQGERLLNATALSDDTAEYENHDGHLPICGLTFRFCRAVRGA